MADRTVKWRTRLRFVLFSVLFSFVNGYEDLYTISQLSPKSIDNGFPQGIVLQTSLPETIDFIIESSGKIEEDLHQEDGNEESNHNRDVSFEEDDSHKENEHIIIARSVSPNRESRSINIDEIPIANNNEIYNDIELHNKRKYYDIQPTKALDYLHTREDDEILMSEGFGDRLEFRFPGEGRRVPKARAITPPGPRLNPTAVQPIFATASYRDEGRQNTKEIQNIITGIVKLLNGNVNVQANSQLLNGRPGRPLASRINNRGPPRISDLPPLPLDFDQPITPPPHQFHPTKTPPPYPFDRPPHVGVNLPEQIVPPISMRPGFHRPLPPWQRPRPRPPARRPNPGLPMYKPMPQLPHDLPELEDPADVTSAENESVENNLHQDEKEPVTTIENVEDKVTTETTTSSEPNTSTTSTTSTSTTTTTEKEITTTEKVTTTDKTTEQPLPTPVETPKPENEIKPIEIVEIKPIEPEEIKPIESMFNITEDKSKETVINKLPVFEIQTSMKDKPTTPKSIAAPTPTEGLLSLSPTSIEPSRDIMKSSSINTLPLSTSQPIPYHPYRRPGIVLDDPEFTRHSLSTAAVITADTRLPGYDRPGYDRPPGYGEIFDVTVSAIQGPGEKGASVHIENVNPTFGSEHDDIIVSSSGDQGFVSIDGKRTYINLFDTSTAAVNIKPSRVQGIQHSVPPLIAPPIDSHAGVAIPTDEREVPRRPAHGHGHGVGHGSGHGQVPHRPPGYRRPQPTVRIDTCIVGDDSTCDLAQNEKCRTEAGISSCQCRAGYSRRTHRDPCRRVVALLLDVRVDKLYDRKIAWDNKLADKDSEPYLHLSYEAVRAIDSAFSMTPFSDEFVAASVNSIHRGDANNPGVFINYTVLMQETPESLRSSISTDIQKHLLGVIRRRSNNIGASALWVDTPNGSVMPTRDVDECSSPELNDCHQLATCTNSWGGFRCQCPDTTLDTSPDSARGRNCKACSSSHCNERGTCRYSNGQPYCSCVGGYYGSTCEVDGGVVGAATGALLGAAAVIGLTVYALRAWSRKWSREQKARGLGSPVFNYMAANTIKIPPVGQPPYQISLEDRMRWAQVAEAMAQAQANHYAQPEPAQMATRPSSAMFGGYPTLPPVPMPRMIHGGHHTGTMNTVTSHHNMYGYTNHMPSESTSSEASSHVQDRADLLVPRPKSRARSMHNQTGIYYDVDYENAPEAIYGSKGIPLSTYTISRGPPFYRN